MIKVSPTRLTLIDLALSTAIRYAMRVPEEDLDEAIQKELDRKTDLLLQLEQKKNKE